MKHVITLAAILTIFATTNITNAGIINQQETTTGNNKTATITLTTPIHNTTAFAIGAWSSLETVTPTNPINVNYTITCAHPTNNKAGSLQLLAGRHFTSSAYIWVGSPTIAGPWLGWDACTATITLSQAGNGLEDHSIIGWVSSHNGT